MKFGIRGQLTDVITCVKFLVDRFRSYGVLTSPKLPFPIDLLRRPYNSVALPCDTVIVHKAYTCAVLILKCFHSRDPFILMQASCVFVRPLLEFSSQVWSPHHKYLIDKVESVRRFFTKRLSGLWGLSYCERLNILGFQTLECRRFINDLTNCFTIFIWLVWRFLVYQLI